MSFKTLICLFHSVCCYGYINNKFKKQNNAWHRSHPINMLSAQLAQEPFSVLLVAGSSVGVDALQHGYLQGAVFTMNL